MHPIDAVHCAGLMVIVMLSTQPWATDARRQTDTSGKYCVINTHTDVINLRSLARQDGKPRFTVNHKAGLVFSFNPCLAFSNSDHLGQSQVDPLKIAGSRVRPPEYVFRLLRVTLPRGKAERRTKNIVLGSTNSVMYPKLSTDICQQPARYPKTSDTCPLGELLFPKHIDIGINTTTNIKVNRTILDELTYVTSPENVTGRQVEIDKDGIDKDGIDKDGNDKDGIDKDGNDKAENEEDGSEESSDSPSSSFDDEGELSEDLNVTQSMRVKRDLQRYPENITAVLRFRSKGRCSGYRSYILLQCDPSLQEQHEAVFQLLSSECNGLLYFMLSHRCCCEGLCPEYQKIDKSRTFTNGRNRDTNLQPWLRVDNDGDIRLNDSYDAGTVVMEKETEKPKFMWLILIVNMAVIGTAICIAAVCCRKGGGGPTHGPYNYLPTLHSSRLTIASSMESFYTEKQVVPPKSPEYLDYTSPIANRNKLPQLSNCVISVSNLEIGQRLGGGLFGDTYLSEWKDRHVAAKRLTVGVHQGQMNEQDHKWLTGEVEHMSKQRHKHLVAVFGVCLDLRQPYIISEYVECESLKDKVIKHSEEIFTWQKKIRMCIQIADGVAFLHSAKPAVLHRDLRCSNVLVDRCDRIKVVDYGMTKLVQRLRQGCNGRKGCYCQKEYCAFPASIRWTAPEILRNPQTDELDQDIITPACDVYSYAMLLWEVASHCDPFEDIPDENEVSELVLDCVRPRVDILTSMIPQLREMMVTCWDDNKEQRPTFKQIAVHLKSCLQIVTKMQHKPRNRNTSSTSYLKTALMAK